MALLYFYQHVCCHCPLSWRKRKWVLESKECFRGSTIPLVNVWVYWMKLYRCTHEWKPKCSQALLQGGKKWLTFFSGDRIYCLKEHVERSLRILSVEIMTDENPSHKIWPQYRNVLSLWLWANLSNGRLQIFTFGLNGIATQSSGALLSEMHLLQETFRCERKWPKKKKKTRTYIFTSPFWRVEKWHD